MGGAILLCALTALACTSRLPPATEPASVPSGYRLLYRAEAETPRGTTHFRMAAAVRPPDHLRLEFFGPVGGSRMLLATDGSTVRAILPRERLADTASVTPQAMARLTGVRIEPAGLIDLLRGRPPCDAAAAPAAEPAGGGSSQGSVSCRFHEALLGFSAGERGWAASISIVLEGPRRSLRLDRVEGPIEASLGDDLFVPIVPEGFGRGNLLGDGPPLLLLEEDTAVPGAPR